MSGIHGKKRGKVDLQEDSPACIELASVGQESSAAHTATHNENKNKYQYHRGLQWEVLIIDMLFHSNISVFSQVYYHYKRGAHV